jgi:hypothetical protein
MFNYRKNMDAHLESALEVLNRGDIKTGLLELVMALQEMSCRLEAIEKRVGVSYDGELTDVQTPSPA